MLAPSFGGTMLGAGGKIGIVSGAAASLLLLLAPSAAPTRPVVKTTCCFRYAVAMTSSHTVTYDDKGKRKGAYTATRSWEARVILRYNEVRDAGYDWPRFHTELGRVEENLSEEDNVEEWGIRPAPGGGSISGFAPRNCPGKTGERSVGDRKTPHADDLVDPTLIFTLDGVARTMIVTPSNHEYTHQAPLATCNDHAHADEAVQGTNKSIGSRWMFELSPPPRRFFSEPSLEKSPPTFHRTLNWQHPKGYQGSTYLHSYKGRDEIRVTFSYFPESKLDAEKKRLDGLGCPKDAADTTKCDAAWDAWK
jgi:hypothetical protein